MPQIRLENLRSAMSAVLAEIKGGVIDSRENLVVALPEEVQFQYEVIIPQGVNALGKTQITEANSSTKVEQNTPEITTEVRGSQTNTNDETGNEIESGNETSNSTQTSTETGTETQTSTETGTQTSTETGTETQTSTETGTQTSTETGTETQTSTETQTGTQTSTETGTDDWTYITD